MTHLDPRRVFAAVSGVRCPECGCACTRGPLPNRSAGVDAIRVICIDCGFAASFQRDATGECREIDDAMKTASDAADAGKLSSREALPAPGTPDPTHPTAAPPAATVSPGTGPQLVEFGQPVDAVLIGLIGQHITIADRQGLVLHQFSLTDFNRLQAAVDLLKGHHTCI